MLEKSETMRRVSDRRSYHYVLTKNNHHIAYRAVGDGDREKWTAEVVSMWEAAFRARSGKPVVDRSDGDKGRFVMSVSIGEMFEIDADNGERLLGVVRKADQRSKRLHYKAHTERPAE